MQPQREVAALFAELVQHGLEVTQGLAQLLYGCILQSHAPLHGVACSNVDDVLIRTCIAEAFIAVTD